MRAIGRMNFHFIATPSLALPLNSTHCSHVGRVVDVNKMHAHQIRSIPLQQLFSASQIKADNLILPGLIPSPRSECS